VKRRRSSRNGTQILSLQRVVMGGGASHKLSQAGGAAVLSSSTKAEGHRTMITESNTLPTEWAQRSEPRRGHRLARHLPRVQGVVAAATLILCGVAGVRAQDLESERGHSHGVSPTQLRHLIDQQVGGINKLKVPATNADIPVPPPKPTQPDRFLTTEAKRYLGKLLFHDPVRTARININNDVPVNLPAGTAFGGTVMGSDLGRVPAIVQATKQTGSCGTCHFGEAATKAGQQINLHVGAEGRGYTDEDGKFIVRRRTQDILVKKRSTPIFAGDTLVDGLPTLTDIDIINGKRVVTTPAAFRQLPTPSALLATGRLDELDSVGRMSMSVIGFAFNNRLLFGGFAGEPETSPGGLNPFEDPAGENITLLLLDAHRMIGEQAAVLKDNKPFVKLFQDAFPKEAAEAAATNDWTKLVNDVTVLRATATFLRTVVTRNTPFDRFIAGDNRALTPSQRRGAQLFFTKATEGGAGCVACHSGPMLNKQINDPDVAGIGRFIEENFINIGIGDHPVQALNALERGRLNPNVLGADGFPYHAEDTGRQEITGNPAHAFKFRSLTLRQLKDGGNFMHNASFTKVRDVVTYFNAGVPQDRTAGAAPTLSTQFTHPRGPGYPRGLGLSARQVDDLTEFLEDGLYDPAFLKFDPHSSTDAFQPHERDLMYSKYRPDLAALGAKDGFMLSGLAINNNDPLSRRDQGLEFLDVTSQAQIALIDRDRDGNRQRDVYRITNNSTTIIDTHLLMVAKGLPRQIQLVNGSGKTQAGDPYLRVYLKEGVIMPGKSIRVSLIFKRGRGDSQANYSLGLLSGQGQP
jgi:Di-haem cytochrome c peroxidase